jgi:hypothetical protein
MEKKPLDVYSTSIYTVDVSSFKELLVNVHFSRIFSASVEFMHSSKLHFLK